MSTIPYGRVITAKFGKDLNGWVRHRPTGAVGCGVWKCIFKGMDSFVKFTRFKVDDGENVLFWTDPWCSRVALCRLFPGFFSLAAGKTRSVKDHMIRSRAFCSWNIQLRRNLND